MPPSDTFFTASPHWTYWVILYFYLGGIAGGAYFLAAIVGIFGTEQDRPLARLGHYVAFPLVLLCGVLLIVDLNQPLRFWHMVIQSKTFWPMFKFWSPMSVGSWALLLFGAFSFISFLGALIESGRLRISVPEAIIEGPVRWIFTVIGGLLGFFLASYTGVLLSVTNRAIWADSPFIGLLFLTSAATTGAAVILLLGHRFADRCEECIAWIDRMDRWVTVLELVAIVAFVVSLGAVATVWLSVWGLALVVGVLLLGILVPLFLQIQPRFLGTASLPTAAVLALIGGLLLRAIVVLAAQAV